jgi:hypothetical protein
MDFVQIGCWTSWENNKFYGKVILVGKSPAYMEPERSVPFLQKPTTGPYPEIAESSSHIHTHSLSSINFLLHQRSHIQLLCSLEEIN